MRYDVNIMQVVRKAVAERGRSLDRDHRTFATPLVVLLGVLTVLLTAAGWILASPDLCAQVHVPPDSADLLLWAILGAVGFFMPLFSALQKEKLALIAWLRAADEALSAWKKDSIAAAAHLLASLAAELAAAVAAQPLRHAEIFEVLGIPHVCLTPRILAQRPSYMPAPRLPSMII